MANNPSTLPGYNGQTKAPDANYTYGSARDDASPGDLTGTPRIAAEINDIMGFQQSLLVDAGIVPSGSPDKVGASQYLDAMKKIINVNALSQTYTFKTVELMQVSAIIFPVGKKIFWQGYFTESDGGSNWGIVKSGAHTDDGGEIFTLADGKFIKANIKGKKLDVKKFGADGTQTIDSITALDTVVAFSIANRKVLSADKADFFKISDTLDLTGVAAKFNFATITQDFTGSPGVILGNDADIEDLDIAPSVANRNDPDLGASAPTDGISHGFKITGRGILRNLTARFCRGNAFEFDIANANGSEWWNLVGEKSDKGFHFGPNTGDNVSICEGSFRAFGNSGPGFFSDPASNFRQNKIYIRSESNNKDLKDVFNGLVIDTFLGGCIFCDLVVYSEGTGGVVDRNIYVDPASSDRNNILSQRQSLDTIEGTNVTRSGTRVWQDDSDGVAAITEFTIANSNVNTFDLRVDFLRGSGRYGKLLGNLGNLYLSNTNEDKILGITPNGAVVGNELIIAGKTILTSGSPSAQIKIADLANNKLMTGTILVRAISGGQGGRRQFTLAWNAFNGVVTFGGVDTSNINSQSDAFGTFSVSQTGTEVFLDLSYDSGNLGGLYDVRWQVNFTTV